MIFQALVEAVEASRSVVIGTRRNLTRDRADTIAKHGRTLIDMAVPEMALTQQDKTDRETAQLCQHQLEELMAALLNQIPD